MTIQLPQHAHCVTCGKAIQAEEKTCSPECAKALADRAKQRQVLQWFLYGSMAILVVVMMLQLRGSI